MQNFHQAFTFTVVTNEKTGDSNTGNNGVKADYKYTYKLCTNQGFGLLVNIYKNCGVNP
jgi:hypothetical protein